MDINYSFIQSHRLIIPATNMIQERREKTSDIEVPVNNDPINQVYRAGISGATKKEGFVWFRVDLQDADEVTHLRKQILHTLYCDTAEIPKQVSFICYINYLCTFDSTLKGLLQAPLERSFRVGTFSYNTWIKGIQIPGFPDENLRDYVDFNITHYIFAYGILGNFIGKVLTAENYAPWKERRVYTYSVAANVDPQDENLNYCFPSQIQCYNIYQSCNNRIEFTRYPLKSIMAAASDHNRLHSPVSEVTLTMLSGVGITNFLFIDHWIVVLNPILLGWEEPAKYIPNLIAAYKKFHALGKNAMYCRMLYKKEYLTEFHREKLKILFTVAREIAKLYGSSSVMNLQGDSSEQFVSEICKGALSIVKTAGGSRTRITEAVRYLLIDHFDNPRLLKVLSQGAETEEATGTGILERRVPDIAI